MINQNRARYWILLGATLCLTFVFSVAHAAEWYFSGKCQDNYYADRPELDQIELFIIGEPSDKTFLVEIPALTLYAAKSSGRYGSVSGSIKTNEWNGQWDNDKQTFLLKSIPSTTNIMCVLTGATPPPGFAQPKGPSVGTGGFVGIWVNNENGGSTVAINADGTGSMTFHTGTRWKKADTPYRFKWVMEEAQLVYSYIGGEDPYRGMMPEKKYFTQGGGGTIVSQNKEAYYKK